MASHYEGSGGERAEGAPHVIDDGDEQAIARAEVPEERRLRDAHFPGHEPSGEGLERHLAQEPQSGLDELGTPILGGEASSHWIAKLSNDNLALQAASAAK